MTVELRGPSLAVLTALADGPKHGYAVLLAIRAASGSAPQPGSLYAILERLERDGLIRAVGDEVVDGRSRRYFDLSDAGLAALDQTVATMEEQARRARTTLAARAVRIAGAGA